MQKIMQLKITLNGSRPPIWRRFLVEDSISLHKLHEIIQVVMGWENYHLYEFSSHGLRITVPHEDDMEESIDSRKIKLKDVLRLEKQRCSYVYDFGDNWEHIIVLEKVLERDKKQKYPVCVAGKMACPREDSGGIWGYTELMEIRKDKNHPSYEESIVEWLGEDFDPEEFSINEINQILQHA